MFRVAEQLERIEGRRGALGQAGLHQFLEVCHHQCCWAAASGILTHQKPLTIGPRRNVDPDETFGVRGIPPA